MKGAKGGFWNLLLERFRMRRLRKNKIKNEEQKLNYLKTIKDINNKKMKENEIIINYYIKANKKKYKLEKIPKKMKVKNSENILASKTQNKKVVINLNEKKNITKENKHNKTYEEKEKEVFRVDSVIKKNTNIKNVKSIEKITKSIESDNLIKINNEDLNIKKKENKEEPTNINEVKIKKQIKNRQTFNSCETTKIKTSKEDLENNLINELKKITGKDRDTLQKLGFKLDELNSKLDNAKTLEEINKIEKEIQEIIKQINQIINNYNAISDGNYKKLNNDKINNVLSKISNSNIVIDIKNKIKNELDYYSKIIDNKKNISSIQTKKESKKQNINSKNQLFLCENTELSNISDINKQLNIKLKEQQDIYKEFNDLITNIKADKIVSTKYSFVDRILNGATSIITGAFSLKLMKQKNVPFFALGLFMLSNSIRNMRKVIKTDETVKYIPSDDYSNAIESNMSSFYLIDNMLSDSLYQISRLKYEYMDEFKNYHGLDNYEKNLNKIINIEKQIINKQQQVNNMKNKMYDALDKNNQKVKIIKDMNK